MISDKNFFYNLLTSLTPEINKTLNFFKGMDYRNNFLKLYDILAYVNDNVEEDFDVIEAFECNSEDEKVNRFMQIKLTYSKELLSYLKKFNKENKYFDINEENKKSKKKHCIVITLNENFDAISTNNEEVKEG